MKYLNKVENYHSKLSLIETEMAIKYVKDTFERILSRNLNLTRVSAPLFVSSSSGINDYLNGTERVIKFQGLYLKDEMEIVQSLAKWKRMSLKKYQFIPETGLYTDMNAIRRDEEPDAIHSLYVDQWDWERILKDTERNITYLKKIVRKVYKSIYDTLQLVNKKFPILSVELPEKIFFISSQDLENLYPTLAPKERENQICKQYQAVFIYQIGKVLNSGQPHDLRAADYDDWELNGDILVWNNVIKSAFELSSMGIRVDKVSLVKQLRQKNELDKINNEYCQAILNDEYPLTIGGGIGQSRLCMFMLEKAHIGEVQVSMWDKEYLNNLTKKNIKLL
ncbi:MAG: aspartate--ammonia ligase [Bacilli bacterium]